MIVDYLVQVYLLALPFLLLAIFLDLLFMIRLLRARAGYMKKKIQRAQKLQM